MVGKKKRNENTPASSGMKRPREERKEHYWGSIFNPHGYLSVEFLQSTTVEITLGPQNLHVVLYRCVDGD